MNTTDLPLFSELYTCYYQVVAKILDEASRQMLTRRQIEDLAQINGYGESALSIVHRRSPHIRLRPETPSLPPAPDPPAEIVAESPVVRSPHPPVFHR